MLKQDLKSQTMEVRDHYQEGKRVFIINTKYRDGRDLHGLPKLSIYWIPKTLCQKSLQILDTKTCSYLRNDKKQKAKS